MEFINLGESGLKISKVIVGCMSYGDKKWADWVLEDEEKVFGILKKCYDNGLRTFDTADVYSNGKSEELLGKFIKKYNIPRERIVILTKLYFPVDETTPGFKLSNYKSFPESDYINLQGLSRKHIFDAANASVKRLGTYIDVLQIHRLDKQTPKAEIMKSLNDVVLQGLTRYIGASSMKATEFAQLQFIAEKNGWFKFISMQNYYNLLYREEEREMIPFCNESEFGKVGLIPWSPNARGLLARPVNIQSQFNRNPTSDKTFKALGLDVLSENDKEIVTRVEKLAKKRGVSMSVVSSAWVLSKGCAPIVGINSEERIDDTIEAVKLKLTEQEINYLEEPYVAKMPLAA